MVLESLEAMFGNRPSRLDELTDHHRHSRSIHGRGSPGAGGAGGAGRACAVILDVVRALSVRLAPPDIFFA